VQYRIKFRTPVDFCSSVTAPALLYLLHPCSRVICTSACRSRHPVCHDTCASMHIVPGGRRLFI